MLGCDAGQACKREVVVGDRDLHQLLHLAMQTIAERRGRFGDGAGEFNLVPGHFLEQLQVLVDLSEDVLGHDLTLLGARIGLYERISITHRLSRVRERD